MQAAGIKWGQDQDRGRRLSGAGKHGGLQSLDLAPTDLTFIHEGNRTLSENLINFEKMVSGRAPWCGPTSAFAPSC